MDAGKSKKSHGSRRNDKLTSFLNNMFRLSKDTLIAAIILGVTGYFFSSYVAFRAHNLEMYDQLSEKIMDFVFTDEILYVFCNSNDTPSMVSDSSVANSLRDIELLKVRFSMEDKFTKIMSDKQKLGIFLSYDNFNKIHKLLYWNNLILTSTKGICNSGYLVSPGALDKWWDILRDSLASERLLHKGRFRSLKDYFLNLFTDVEAHYYIEPVDLSKLPISAEMKINKEGRV